MLPAAAAAGGSAVGGAAHDACLHWCARLTRARRASGVMSMRARRRAGAVRCDCTTAHATASLAARRSGSDTHTNRTQQRSVRGSTPRQVEVCVSFHFMWAPNSCSPIRAARVRLVSRRRHCSHVSIESVIRPTARRAATGVAGRGGAPTRLRTGAWVSKVCEYFRNMHRPIDPARDRTPRSPYDN